MRLCSRFRACGDTVTLLPESLREGTTTNGSSPEVSASAASGGSHGDGGTADESAGYEAGERGRGGDAQYFETVPEDGVAPLATPTVPQAVSALPPARKSSYWTATTTPDALDALKTAPEPAGVNAPPWLRPQPSHQPQSGVATGAVTEPRPPRPTPAPRPPKPRQPRPSLVMALTHQADSASPPASDA